jgi:hypothetical protein
MKQTVGIVVGVVLVCAVVVISMWRDSEPVKEPLGGPLAIVNEMKTVAPHETTRANPHAPEPIPPVDGDVRGAPVASAAVARGLVLAAGEESRSAPAGTIDKDGVQAAMRAVKPQIAECYEKALKHDPDLSGRLVVEFTIEAIDGGGAVSAGEIHTSDMSAPFFEACVLREVVRTPFPLPSGSGTVKVKYPFSFDQGAEHAH